MKFGLFHSVQLPDPSKQQQYYQDARKQVVWAEQRAMVKEVRDPADPPAT